MGAPEEEWLLFNEYRFYVWDHKNVLGIDRRRESSFPPEEQGDLPASCAVCINAG